MKTRKITHYISTGLLSLIMVMSAGMYLFNHDVVSQSFANLGFPTYIIYPLAIAKILGLVAIWTGASKSLREWAYAGFFFNTLLATTAHMSIGDGEFAPALAALVLVLVSYFSKNKLS